VLAWAVMGCVEWYQHGLGSSAAVDRATAAYRTETDMFERFMSERCEFGPDKSVTKADLYEAYEEWCAEEDEEPKTIKTFGSTMKEKGVVKNFEERRTKKDRMWKGIGLRESVTDTPLRKNLSPPKSPANKRVVKHRVTDYPLIRKRCLR